MKFGTRLRVTNPDNNRSVVVTVNDRGPFIAGRDLDLSYGAAKAIGLTEKGVGRVKIEFLGRDNRYVKRIAFAPSKTPISGGLAIQVGSFTEASRAHRLKRGLEVRYKDVYISTADVKGTKYYRVQVGKYSSYNSAYSVAKKLAEEGYSTFITSR
jgi:rare lipoprotein A